MPIKAHPVTDIPWIYLSVTPKTGPFAGQKQRWRGPVRDYTDTRLTDAAFRERCALPSGKASLSLRELERYIEPVARQDWTNYVLGKGPDPRKALVEPTEIAVLTISEVMDLWFAKRELKTELRSLNEDKTKMEFLRRWYGARPVTDLLEVEPHEEFARHCKTRGNKRATFNRHMNSVIKPLTAWAISNRVLPADSRMPFGKHLISTSGQSEKAEKRPSRRVEPVVEAKLHKALDGMPIPKAARLKDFLIILCDLALRPYELAFLRRGAINYTTCTITFKDYTTKDSEQREVPYNPNGRVAKVLTKYRFLPETAYIFGKDGKATHKGVDYTDAKLSWSDYRRFVAKPICNQFNEVWKRAVILAHGGKVETRRSAKTKRGKTVLTETALAFYHRQNLVIRDFRHEGTVRMRSAGVPYEYRRFVMGHRTGLSEIYEKHDLVNIARPQLATTLWAAEDAGQFEAKRSVG